MAATAIVGVPFISVEEYLHTSYAPDVDYVDGVVEERAVGELDHADLQSEIVTLLRNQSKSWGIRAVVEARVQTSETRFRVPDICVLSASTPREQIVRTPPLLCIEVLSPEDRFSRSQKKYNDYLFMGVPEVWVFDTARRVAYVVRPGGRMTEQHEGSLELAGSAIKLALHDLFAVLDEG